jgi:ElaB/YqjD/DUF883 family membrane-anchored ribosome-binding protein
MPGGRRPVLDARQTAAAGSGYAATTDHTVMKDAMPRSNDLREQLVTDVKLMLVDTEDLLKAVSAESKEKIAGVKPRIEAAMQRARTHIAETESALEARARQRADELHAYASEHPWQTAGTAAALGAALGAIIGVLLARR